MEDKIRNDLIKKNNKIIDMVIERAKKEFPDDIAIIGLTGSFSTDDFHEKSDIDLIIINNTDRGWEISYCFIWEDIGYDIYCTPYEPRLVASSTLESPYISCLIDLKILYCSKPEHMDEFNMYKQRALDELAKPIGKSCLQRAKKKIDLAKQEYADVMLENEIGAVRYAAGGVLFNVINAIVDINNTYIKRGVKRYVEELSGYEYLPDDFLTSYMAVIDAKTIDDLRSTSYLLLSNLVCLYNSMVMKFIEKPVPTFENLNGTYEELWCNCRNKIITSCELNDKSYAFHSALGAQSYLDEMAIEHVGTPKYDLMQHFDSDNLQVFKSNFLKIMDNYLLEYIKVGRKVEKFDTFDELYSKFMNRCVE